MTEPNRSPRDCAHGGRSRAEWLRLPLIAVCVVLYLTGRPDGVLAQTQVAQPTIGAVTPGDGRLSIAWTAPQGVTGTTAYDLRHIRSDAADKADSNWTVLEDVWTAGSGDLTYTLEDLDNGVGYDVQMRAVTTTDGAWSATATGTPADHGGTLQTATALPPATRTGGVIESGTDADFFKLELNSATGIIVHTRGDLDTVGQLLDGDGELLSENDVGDELHGRHNFLLWGSLQAGTYYVKVTAGGGATGAYVLEATTVADSTARSDAHDVEVGSYGWGIIDPASSDRDWFRITLTAPTTLLIHSTGSAATWGDLWQSGNLEVPNTEEFPLGTSPRFGFFVRVALGAGTYYVEVGGPIDGTGAYALHVNRGAEPGSSTASAEPLVPLFPKAGTISPTDDVDYFRIEFAEATHVILSATGSAVPIAGELLDSDGTPVDANIREARWTASGPAGFQLRDRLGAGTHYLKVTRLAGRAGPSTGRYGLRMYEDYVYGEFVDGCTALTASLSDPLSDPLSGCQWHLDNTGQLGGTAGEDINVREVWEAGHLGAGATVALVDNGMDIEHPDLAPNVLAERNYAFGSSRVFNAGNTHGTGAAGLIAARDNGIGVRGVAPRAQIYVYNIIDDYNHAHAAAAMTRGMETTAVSNNSWSQTEGPGYATAPSGWVDAVVRGVTEGYGGKGVLYVRSGGNDAVLGANSNLSGFRNHYTGTAVCAVTDRGVRSHYSEQGANLWVCAPSGASYLPAAITTTDNFGRYRNTYGGTSATAAIVSGVAALVRGAHADLTWRDVKLILAGSARKNDPSNTGWEEGAPQYGSATERYEFNHEYGFGVVDAGAAMDLAAGWTSLPQLTEETQASGDVSLAVPDLPSSGTPTTVTSSITMGSGVQFTEFVSIRPSLTAAAFRDLQIELESPSGKVSVLSPYHLVGPGECRSLFGILPGQCNLDGSLRLGSARHLGEDPAGVWTLRIADRVDGGADARLNSWSLTVYGHRSTPAAPAIDSVADGSEALTVAWTAPTNTGASGVTAYDVRSIRSDAADKSDSEWTVVDDAWTSTSGALEYTISGLTGDVQYDVQVRAVNAQGDGVWSGTQTGTPTTDKAPTIDSAMPVDRAITVEWTAPTNATLGTVTSYDLRHIRSDASDKADARWTVVTSIWTSGTLEYALNPTPALVNGVSYDVQVRAVVGTDQHPWSGVRSATPHTTPGAATIDTITGADGSLTVEWSEPASDGGDEITSYDLRYIKTSEDETADTDWAVTPGVWSSGDTGLEYQVMGLDDGTRYDVQVRAVNGAGAGAWSAAGVGTTRPGAPAIDSVTGVARGLTVGWSAPASDGDATVTSYDLRYIETSADETVEAHWTVETGAWTSGDLTATVTGLDVGTQYDVQARAVNASGEGPWSATRTGTTALSDDATLSALTLTGVRLAPAFSSGTTSYTASVGYTVTRVTLAAPPSDVNAGTEILDGSGNTRTDADSAAGFQVDLSVGDNVIQVEVTAQDGVAKETYGVTVTRTGPDLSLTPPANDPAAPFASTAAYTVRFQGRWTATVTPEGRPGGAHFSPLIGGVHGAGATFLESGARARGGVELMAERGRTGTLRNEVRAAVDATPPTALSVLRRSGNIGATGPDTLSNVMLTTEFPRVTLTTMIAPSPDWFVGVSGLPLLNAAGRWLRTHDVDLFPWDAGTEDGSGFSLSNPATSPRGVITSIRGTGKFTTERIASLTFTLQSVRTERGLFENTPAGVNIGPPVSPAASGSSVSHTLGGTDAASFELVGSTGQLRTKDGVTYDHDTRGSYTVTVTATDADGSIATTVEIAVEDIDEPPVITGPTSVEFAENRRGTVATYRASDPEGEAVTWQLAGPDGGAFELDESGVLTIEEPPDHEAQERYELILRASADGELGVQTHTLDVTVTVVDVDEPADVSFAATGGVTVNGDALSVHENHDGALATFTASDPENKPGLTYEWSVGGTDRADFAITAAGVLSFAGIPDHERPADSGRDNVYDIAVNALDSDGNTGSIAVTVTVDPVNELPTITGDAAPSIEEGGTLLVGTYRATDPEDATIAWQPLAGSDSDEFDLTSSNGRLEFKAAPDFEDPGRGGDNVYEVTLGVSAGGDTITLVVAVTVTNKEEPGMLVLPATRPQVEADHTATLGDPDGVQSTTWTWERSTSRSGPWTTVSGTVDSTTASVYTPVTGDIGHYLRATAAYTDGHGPDKSLSAVSGNSVRAAPIVNSPPSFAETTPTRSIAENARVEAPVGNPVTATDPDLGDTVGYEFEPPGSDLFTIDSDSGQIRVKAAGALDHETAPSHTVTVRAGDSSNAFGTVQVTIDVTDVNEPPDAVADAPSRFDEDTETTIDVLANDSDPEQERSELLLTVVTPPLNGRARVNEPATAGGNRTITYEPDADYNGSDTFSYQVRDTGSPPLSSAATVSVEVGAVNDAPTFASPDTTRSVSESAEAGDSVGAPVTATDVDEHDPLTYSLSGLDESSFVIDAGGQITVGPGVAFDAATTPEYAVTVEARDRAGASASIEVTITVTVEPVISGGGGFGGGGGPVGDGGGGGGGAAAVVEVVGAAYAAAGAEAVFTAAVSDGTAVGAVRWAVTGPDGFAATGSGPRLVFVAPAGGTYTVSVTVDDAGGGTLTGSVTLTVLGDIAGHHFADPIVWLAERGITVGCTRQPPQYCPDRPVTRAQMASFLTRALDLDTPAQRAGFADVDPAGVHADAIEALYGARITVGCASEPLRYCPDKPVTRAQMASFLTRALDLDTPAQRAGFADVDPAGVHADAIEALYGARITVGCASEPLRYCPDRPVTRAQMAAFLYRARDLIAAAAGLNTN